MKKFSIIFSCAMAILAILFDVNMTSVYVSGLRDLCGTFTLTDIDVRLTLMNSAAVITSTILMLAMYALPFVAVYQIRRTMRTA